MFKKILKILKKILDLKIEKFYPIAYLVIEDIKYYFDEKEKEEKITDEKKVELLEKICDDLTAEFIGLKETNGSESAYVHPFQEDSLFETEKEDEKFEKVGISGTKGVVLSIGIKEKIINKVKERLEKEGFKIKKIKVFDNKKCEIRNF